MPVLLALALLIGQDQAPPLQLSAGSPSPAAAYAGRQVVRADVLIDGETSQEAMLLGLVETPPGQPLSMASVRETIAHFSSLGRFQDISVDATAEGDGVALRYQLVPIYNVERIEFVGNLGLGSGELRRAVTNRFGATPTASRASSVAEMLQSYYFDRGFLAAAVRPGVRERAGRDGAILTFEIESGARASIRDVAVQGTPANLAKPFFGTSTPSPPALPGYDFQGRWPVFGEVATRAIKRAEHRSSPSKKADSIGCLTWRSTSLRDPRTWNGPARGAKSKSSDASTGLSQ